MKKFRISLLAVCISALCAEIFGKGAVCVFAISPEETKTELFSYFSLTPYGYANFGPFITAVLTILLVLFSLILFTKKAEKITKCTTAAAVAALVTSLLPLIMFGPSYFNTVSYIISALLAGTVVLSVFVKKEIIKNEA